VFTENILAADQWWVPSTAGSTNLWIIYGITFG